MGAQKWVMIVAGGLLQVPAVRAAHELGYQVVVSDRNLDCACAALADHFVELDTFDVGGHIEFVKHWSYGLAAVFTAGADPIVTVARAAEAAGCQGLDWGIAYACANKMLTRVSLATKDVPQPDYMVINGVRDLFEPSICERWGGIPFIVKATGSSGSRGHTRIGVERSFGEVELAVITALEHSNGMVLFEELLTGIELSVESLWYDGAMIPLNAVERPFLEDTNIELGHYNPWVGSTDDYAAVWDIVEKAGRAVGLGGTQGGHIFKADLMLTDDGPKVLELTTRLSGGFDSGWTSPLAHGVDYTKGALLLALGEPLSAAMPYFAPRHYRHAACMAALGPPDGGIIKEIRGLDEARAIAEVVLRFDVGDELPPLTDCAARVAFCVTANEKPDHARYDALDAAGLIEVLCE